MIKVEGVFLTIEEWDRMLLEITQARDLAKVALDKANEETIDQVENIWINLEKLMADINKNDFSLPRANNS